LMSQAIDTFINLATGLSIGFALVALIVLLVLVTLLMVEACVLSWRRIVVTKQTHPLIKKHIQ